MLNIGVDGLGGPYMLSTELRHGEGTLHLGTGDGSPEYFLHFQLTLFPEQGALHLNIV